VIALEPRVYRDHHRVKCRIIPQRYASVAWVWRPLQSGAVDPAAPCAAAVTSSEARIDVAGNGGGCGALLGWPVITVMESVTS
jgi:hypothetical protein